MKERFDIDKEALWGRLEQDDRMPGTEGLIDGAGSQIQWNWWTLSGAVIVTMGLSMWYFKSQDQSSGMYAIETSKVEDNTITNTGLHSEGLEEDVATLPLSDENSLEIGRSDVESDNQTISTTTTTPSNLVTRNKEMPRATESSMLTKAIDRTPLETIQVTETPDPTRAVEEADINKQEMGGSGTMAVPPVRRAEKESVKDRPTAQPGAIGSGSDSRGILAQSSTDSGDEDSVQGTSTVSSSTSTDVTSRGLGSESEVTSAKGESKERPNVNTSTSNATVRESSTHPVLASLDPRPMPLQSLLPIRLSPPTFVVPSYHTSKHYWLYADVGLGQALTRHTTLSTAEPPLRTTGAGSLSAEIGWLGRWDRWDVHAGVGVLSIQSRSTWLEADTLYTDLPQENDFMREERATRTELYQQFRSLFAHAGVSYKIPVGRLTLAPSLGIRYHFQDRASGSTVFDTQENIGVIHARLTTPIQITVGLQAYLPVTARLDLRLGLSTSSALRYRQEGLYRQELRPVMGHISVLHRI